MKIVKRNIGHTESFIPHEMVVTIESQDEYNALRESIDNLSADDFVDGGVSLHSALIIERLLDGLARSM
jgi:hypothetical protein|tara:strand:- start:3424 stop:3630 length:207 start_codon:yes stop_codon:yes gene_type:complete